MYFVVNVPIVSTRLNLSQVKGGHMNRFGTAERLFSVVVILGLLASGCATDGSGGLTERETSTLLGSGLGAGLGALVGHQTGHAGAGTAIGAGAGALAGALAGEGLRRTKENAKNEMRQELMQQQYQAGYAPQYAPAPQYAQPQIPAAPQAPVQEVHTKYNPRTGQTFPERYQYDPATGEQLKYL